jgi:signal transduction histidine kinase
MDEPSSSAEQAGARVVPALRGGSSMEAAEDLVEPRARQLLRLQTFLVVFAAGATLLARMSGSMPLLTSSRFLAACVGTAIITAMGWILLLAPIRTRLLIVCVLVLDAVLGYPAVYLSDGLGSPAAAGILTCLPLTLVFAGRRYLLSMAVLHWVLYSSLLIADTTGVWRDILPASLLPTPVGGELADVVGIWSAFSVGCFATAFILRVPSLDASQQSEFFADEVRRNTQALERTSNKLARANADFVGLNAQLSTANGELVVVNADLATVVEEFEEVNSRLRKSNAELGLANAELEQTNTALQRSNERLDQFNTAVSHDLRAPLQAIMARAELAAVAAQSDPSRVARMADQICDSATRMARQLDEMYKLSRLEDRLESVESVPLGGLLGEVVHDLEPKIRSRRVNLEVVHPLPHLVGSRGLLAELFLNLIDNAIKYGASDRPRVRVTAVSTEDGWAAVAVEDNGPGIPEDQRTRVFQLFQRLTRDQEVDGVGAGLAIVRRIVGVHGGKVTVEQGEALGGARFVVRMPLQEGASSAIAVDQPAPVSSSAPVAEA